MTRPRLEPDYSQPRAPGVRACDHPGCAAAGDFRAPRSRAVLDEYYWFCLQHVRAYNAAWNYYAGMSEAEIEREIRNDTTWQRPSWPLGSRHGPSPGARWNDPLGVFEEGEGAASDGPRQERARARRLPSEQEAALKVFELDPPFTLVHLKARYKELVKLHHPDRHGGDKAAEERLKVINQAYSTLKASYFS
jgi:DnaJ-domain-containing protein 1